MFFFFLKMFMSDFFDILDLINELSKDNKKDNKNNSIKPPTI